jgi:hypothetical protein
MKQEMSRRAAATKAGKNGSDRFRFFCETCGKNRMHYVSDTKCVFCTKQRGKRRTEERRQDPELQKKQSDATRQRYHEDIGRSREYFAAVEWRKATKAEKMHAWYPKEQKAMQAVYAGLIEAKRGNEPDKKFKKFRQQGDHLISKVAKAPIEIDGKVKVRVVVNGLHTFANLAPLSAVLNQSKGSAFDPDNCRYQRPANRHPGGAWDPDLTPDEREHIQELWTVEGIPIDESLKTHRDILDRDARVYERHAKENHEVEILVDPAWYECRVPPERKAVERPRHKGFEGEPEEETVQTFMTMLQKQSEK